MIVGRPMTGLASKTLDRHQSVHSISDASVTGSASLIQSPQSSLGTGVSATRYYPEPTAPVAVRDTVSGMFAEPADLQRDDDRRRSHYCLALNVYWEARNQALSGQLAVAQVTMNRVRDRRYPNDICDVVYDHRQFSWYWDGLSDSPKDTRAWENALLVASAAIHGSGHVELNGVTHYHAVYSQPYWKDSMTLVTTIGDHLFYIE
jgi:spore germination cell wall hydrolase CwlJ-like protein